MTDKPPDALRLARLPTPIGTALLVTDEAGVLRAFDFEDFEGRMGALVAPALWRDQPRGGRGATGR